MRFTCLRCGIGLEVTTSVTALVIGKRKCRVVETVVIDEVRGIESVDRCWEENYEDSQKRSHSRKLISSCYGQASSMIVKPNLSLFSSDGEEKILRRNAVRSCKLQVYSVSVSDPS